MKINNIVTKIILYIISIFLILCLIGVYFNKEGFIGNDDDDVSVYKK